MAAKHSLGWIGMGRMGYPMAERLLKAGQLRCDLEPDARQGRAAGQEGRARSSIVRAELSGDDIVFTMVSTGKDLEQVYFGEDGVVAGCRRAAAEDPGRLLLDRHRTVGGDPRAAEATGLRIRQRAGERQRQVRQGRQALSGRLGSEGRLRTGRAVSGDDRGFRRRLRRRRRARAHLQDRAQRLPRRRHPEPRRDHHPGAEGRRAAPRLPRFHERQRDGLDVHPVQEQCAGQSRLDHDLHARAAAQGPRSRA